MGDPVVLGRPHVLPAPSDSLPHRCGLAVLAWTFIASLALGACSGDPQAASTAPTQVVARVNGGEITVHQVNAVLRRQSQEIAGDGDAAARAVLERLIDQELVVKKAQELQLEREPELMQEIEAARRSLLARAWADRAAQAAAVPGEEEIRRHYEDNADLYAARREFSLQQITVQGTAQQVQELQQRLVPESRVVDLMRALRQGGLRWSSQPTVRTAEQLSPAALKALTQLRDGQALLSATPRGAVVLVRLASRAQPLSLEAARPAIEQRLRLERRRQIVEQDLKALREAASIEYVGPFAAIDAPVAPESTAPSAQSSASAAVPSMPHSSRFPATP